MEEKSPDLLKFDELYDKFCKQYKEMFTIQTSLQEQSMLLKNVMGEDVFLKYIDDLANQRKQTLDDKEKGIEIAQYTETKTEGDTHEEN